MLPSPDPAVPSWWAAGEDCPSKTSSRPALPWMMLHGGCWSHRTTFPLPREQTRQSSPGKALSRGPVLVYAGAPRAGPASCTKEATKIPVTTKIAVTTKIYHEDGRYHEDGCYLITIQLQLQAPPQLGRKSEQQLLGPVSKRFAKFQLSGKIRRRKDTQHPSSLRSPLTKAWSLESPEAGLKYLNAIKPQQPNYSGVLLHCKTQ